MAYAYVASASASGTNTFSTSAINTTGASLLVCLVSHYDATGAPTLSDSNTNTWTHLTEPITGIARASFYYAKNPTVGSGHTFTLTGTGIYSTLVGAAFSGADTTAPFDQENNTGGGALTSGGTAKAGSITPTVDNELVVAGIGDDSTATMSLSGYTVSDQQPYSAGVNFGGAFGYAIQTTATATDPPWTFTGGTVNGSCVIASFKAAAGGGGNDPPEPLLYETQFNVHRM